MAIPAPGQSHADSLCQDSEQVFLIQADFESLSFQAGFAGFIFSQQV